MTTGWFGLAVMGIAGGIYLVIKWEIILTAYLLKGIWYAGCAIAGASTTAIRAYRAGTLRDDIRGIWATFRARTGPRRPAS